MDNLSKHLSKKIYLKVLTLPQTLNDRVVPVSFTGLSNQGPKKGKQVLQDKNKGISSIIETELQQEHLTMRRKSSS